MKTRKNINPNIKMSFAATTLFVFSTLGIVNASDSENKSVYERLERMSSRMEETLRYKAPAEPEAETYVYSDYEVAENRLEVLNQEMEQSIRYKAPEVTEDIEEYEVQAAWERLENMTLAMEESIKF
jgi:hypothetical protein